MFASHEGTYCVESRLSFHCQCNLEPPSQLRLPLAVTRPRRPTGSLRLTRSLRLTGSRMSLRARGLWDADLLSAGRESGVQLLVINDVILRD